MKFLFVAKGDDDPATRYRVMPLLRYLRSRDHQAVVIRSDASPLKLLASARQAEVVIIQRRLFSGLLVWLLRRAAKKLIFDYDDAIFLKSSGVASRRRMGRFRAIVARSDCIWAGNQYLADAGRRFNPHCQVIPTPVEDTKYVLETEKDETFTLVWIGSRSTRKYLDSHVPVLERIGKEVTGVRLKIISDFQFPLNNLEVHQVAWSGETEALELNRSHVGIAPMDDNDWTRGKCALKVIQYMASSLPVISSPVGANREVLLPGETGILASCADEWVAAVTTLKASNAMRRRLGETGYRRFAAYYSESAVISTLTPGLSEIGIL